MKVEKNLFVMMVVFCFVIPLFILSSSEKVRLQTKTPKLKGVAKDAVALRYKWVVGQKVAATCFVNEKRVRYIYKKNAPALTSNLRIDFSLKVLAVDAENSAKIEMRIKRCVFVITNGSTGTTIYFDSAKPAGKVKRFFRVQPGMFDQPIVFNCSPLGKVSKINMKSLEAAFNRNGAFMLLGFMRSKIIALFDLLFLRFGKQPSVGGRVNAWPVKNRVGDNILLSGNNWIHSITKEKKAVLVKTAGSLKLVKSDSFIKNWLEDKLVSGWSLFNIATGRVSKGYRKVGYTHCWDMGRDIVREAYMIEMGCKVY